MCRETLQNIMVRYHVLARWAKRFPGQELHVQGIVFLGLQNVAKVLLCVLMYLHIQINATRVYSYKGLVVGVTL